MKVLIVEDELIIANYIKNILEDQQIEVVDICTSYPKAVFSVVKNKPDVILLDIQIEGALSGIDIANKLRSYMDTCIIYVSGNTSEDFFNDVMASNPNGFLSKPVNPTNLVFSVKISYQKYLENLKIRESAVQATKEMNQLDNNLMVGSFIHDVMNPLLSLQNQIAKIPEEGSNEKESLTQKVQILLDILISFRKKIGSASITEVIDIHNLAKKILVLTEYQCIEKGFRLNVIPCEGHIKGDTSNILRIISNLINNSLQANKENSEKWIEIKFSEEDSNIVCLVTDSGKGIPKEVQESLFNKNFTTKKEEGGSGIGLFTAQTYLNSIDGDISLDESAENTTFKLVFSK